MNGLFYLDRMGPVSEIIIKLIKFSVNAFLQLHYLRLTFPLYITGIRLLFTSLQKVINVARIITSTRLFL